MLEKDPDYLQELDYLYNLQKYGIKFGLSQTSNLLQGLGNPHQGRKYIHIAGTNGKGSVASFLNSILQLAGYKTGLYTSPHLVSFRERMQINSQYIPQHQVVEFSRQIRRIQDPQEPPTFFEAVTAMALAYFAQENTDVDIIEVGMGGRLDATNLIQSQISMITNISLEHREFLGNTLHQVAREKAGIIKARIPVLSSAKQPGVRELFARIAHEKDSPFYQQGLDFRVRRFQEGFTYFGLQQKLKGLRTNLIGSHQMQNAGLALAACEILNQTGWKINTEHMRQGLQKATWPGRMQLVQDRPKIMLDGAHNPEAIKVLAQCLNPSLEYQRLILVLGMMADKEIEKMLAQILPRTDYAIFTRPVYERALDPEELRSRATPWNVASHAEQSLPRALDQAQDLATPEDLILVCGSLFTVGEALEHLQRYETDAQG
ncbi:MAG: folylpolyglutamate synthase/dihydrofolate synthase family protein [Desulfohalobiaceae bacterium]